MQKIDDGYNIRFDKVYGHLLNPESQDRILEFI